MPNSALVGEVAEGRVDRRPVSSLRDPNEPTSRRVKLITDHPLRTNAASLLSKVATMDTSTPRMARADPLVGGEGRVMLPGRWIGWSNSPGLRPFRTPPSTTRRTRWRPSRRKSRTGDCWLTGSSGIRWRHATRDLSWKAGRCPRFTIRRTSSKRSPASAPRRKGRDDAVVPVRVSLDSVGHV